MPSDPANTTAGPAGGYAPGPYECRCLQCGMAFVGDKRAISCKQCATPQTTKLGLLWKVLRLENVFLVPVPFYAAALWHIAWMLHCAPKALRFETGLGFLLGVGWSCTNAR